MGKYEDRYAEASKRFNEWGNSEEGQRNRRERSELIQKAKSAGAEELGKAVDAIATTPSKRANAAVETPAPAGKTTAPSSKTTAPVKEPFLDASVLEEAR